MGEIVVRTLDARWIFYLSPAPSLQREGVNILSKTRHRPPQPPQRYRRKRSL